MWWNTFLLILLDYIKVMFEFTKGKFREVPISYFCCSCAPLLLFKHILNLRRPLDFVIVLIYSCISIVSLDCYLHLWFTSTLIKFTSIPIVYRSTDTASSHSEGFLRNLHKKVPLENVTRVPCVKYLSPRMNRKKMADNHTQQTTDNRRRRRQYLKCKICISSKKAKDLEHK